MPRRSRRAEVGPVSPKPKCGEGGPTFCPPAPSNSPPWHGGSANRGLSPSRQFRTRMRPLIRLQGITRHFPGDAGEPAVALQDVTVDIERGEFVSVSGPSGCGKSTFLSIIGLLDTPTSGRYFLKGRATDRLSPNERARTRNVDIGLVFQSFNLIGDLTVYENVEYPLTIKGAAPDERRRRVMAALERVGLSARATQRPSSLSGGHQQLVADRTGDCRPAADRPGRRAHRATWTRRPAKWSCGRSRSFMRRDRRSVWRRTTRTTSRWLNGTSSCSTGAWSRVEPVSRH